MDSRELLGAQPGFKQLDQSANKLTIQSDVRQEVQPGSYGSSMLLYMSQQNDLVAPWWSWRRDEDLLRIVGECDVLAGALYAYTSKMAALPFRIEPVDPSVSGHWKLAAQYEMLLYEGSDFFAGWEEFFTRWLYARSTQDNGAFFEVIGAGRPDQEITGPAVGIALLDSSRCTRTGNPEYPVVYTDVDSRAYKLHYSRVGYSSQLPSIRKEMYKVGFCAVSRCLAFAQSVIDDLLYHQEKLGSRPPRAILVGSKIGLDSIQTAFTTAQNLATATGRRRFGSLATVANPHGDVNLNLVSLSNLPDGFDFVTDLTQSIYAIALAFGIPPRWLWPASQTGATKADAMYMHLAGSQTGPAFELRTIRNLLGGADTSAVSLTTLRPQRFLPPTLKMVFDLQDDEQDLQAAQIASTRATARTQDLGTGVINARTAREQMVEDGEITAEQFEDLELADGRTPDGMDVKDLPYTDNEYVRGVTAATPAEELTAQLDAARQGYATATTAARKSAAHMAIACLAAYLKDAAPKPAPPPTLPAPVPAGGNEAEETPEQAAPVEKPTPAEEAETAEEGKELGVKPQLRRQGTYRQWVKAVNEYAGQLLNEWTRWADTTARQIARSGKQDHAKLIEQAADDIVTRMDRLARERLPDAYSLGAKRDFALTKKGTALVDQFANRNNGFLQTSLRPAIKARLQQVVAEYQDEQRTAGKVRGEKGLSDLLESIREALGSFVGRIATYAGPFWSLINQGLGEKWEEERQRAFVEGLMAPKIAWALDPAAQHCDTCPPKAKEYDSLDDLVHQCGGFPGEGQDSCGCNCRCYVEII